MAVVREFLFRLLGKRQSVEMCSHTNLKELRWLENGTPMIRQNCLDCGFRDEGHVHANPETWLDA